MEELGVNKNNILAEKGPKFFREALNSSDFNELKLNF
jgi:hypothetical protein